VTQTGVGCTATASVTVLATALDVSFAFKAPSCPGRNDGYVVIKDITGGMEPYSVNLNNAGITADSIGNLAPGSYELYVEDVNGCSWTDDIVLTAPVAPVINAGPDFLLHLGDSMVIQATTNVNVLLADTLFWTPSDWLSCFTCLQPEIKPLNNQELTVTVVDQNGCVASDKVIVRVQKDRRVFIPNIFSPEVENGGSNVLTVYTGAEVRKIKTFLIFDRWGENIYRADDMLPNSGFGWDGKFRGKYPNNDVYVYMVEVEFIDGETEVFSGDVTLYR
jgi:gliding motility-associated-like protein